MEQTNNNIERFFEAARNEKVNVSLSEVEQLIMNLPNPTVVLKAPMSSVKIQIKFWAWVAGSIVAISAVTLSLINKEPAGSDPKMHHINTISATTADRDSLPVEMVNTEPKQTPISKQNRILRTQKHIVGNQSVQNTIYNPNNQIAEPPKMQYSEVTPTEDGQNMMPTTWLQMDDGKLTAQADSIDKAQQNRNKAKIERENNSTIFNKRVKYFGPFYKSQNCITEGKYKGKCYNSASGFYFNYGKWAKVQLKKQYGFVDHTGAEVVKPKYTDIRLFNTYRPDWCEVEIEGRYGFIDTTGKEIVPVLYDKIDYFGEYVDGWARVRLKKKFGFIDTTGREIVPPKYDKIAYPHQYKEGWIEVITDHQHGFIDMQGEKVVRPKYDKIYFESEMPGWYKVKIDGLYGFIDSTGQEIVAPIYDKIGYFDVFHDGLAKVILKGQEGFIDRKGKLVNPKKEVKDTLSTSENSTKEVIFIFDKPDTTNFVPLGELSVTEKFFFYHNNDIKEETIIQLIMKTKNRKGDVIYINTNSRHDGYGIGVTRTITACIYKKT